MKQLKKAFLVMMLSMVVFAGIFSPISNSFVSIEQGVAYAKGGNEGSGSVRVNSQGLLIKAANGEIVCQSYENVAEGIGEEELEQDSGFNIEKIISNFVGKQVVATFELFLSFIGGVNTCGDQTVTKYDIDAEDSDEDEEGEVVWENDNSSFLSLGIGPQFNIFTKPVNITNIKMLMGVTGFTQQLAMVLMVLFILYEGFRIMRGSDPSVNESSIITFVIRFAAVMMAIYYSPALMQDILSLNNKIVHTVATSPVDFKLDFGTKEMSFEQMPISYALLGILASFASISYNVTMGFIVGTKGVGIVFSAGIILLMAILMLVILLVVLVPLVKLMVWWYTRLFKIFIATALMPVFLITFLADSTSSIGRKYVTEYVNTVFEQLVIVLGFVVIMSFILETQTIVSDLEIGLVGIAIAMYAGFTFLSQLPDVIGGMMAGGEGAFNSKGMANKLASPITSIPNKEIKGKTLGGWAATGAVATGAAAGTLGLAGAKLAKDGLVAAGGKMKSGTKATWQQWHGPNPTRGKKGRENYEENIEKIASKGFEDWGAQQFNFASQVARGEFDNVDEQATEKYQTIIGEKPGGERRMEEEAEKLYDQIYEKDVNTWTEEETEFMEGYGSSVKTRQNYFRGTNPDETRPKEMNNLSKEEFQVVSNIAKRRPSKRVYNKETGEETSTYNFKGGRVEYVRKEGEKEAEVRVISGEGDNEKVETFKVNDKAFQEKRAVNRIAETEPINTRVDMETGENVEVYKVDDKMYEYRTKEGKRFGRVKEIDQEGEEVNEFNVDTEEVEVRKEYYRTDDKEVKKRERREEFRNEGRNKEKDNNEENPKN